MTRRERRVKSHGKPEGDPGVWAQAIDRIGAKIKPQHDGCWLWTGRIRDDGYGVTPHGVVAHRYVYEILVGPIEYELVLHHECEVRACCNPHHCIPMTNGDHVAMHAAQRRKAS